jgi:hypothetical protein
MKVRNALLLAATLLGAGCSDPSSVCNQSEMIAGMAAADIETLYRVCGGPRRNVVTAVAERGDVWPPAPQHVPTSLDLLRDPAIADRTPSASQTVRHARGYGLCRPISRPAAAGAPAAPPGVALGLCYAPLVHGSTATRNSPA